MKLLFFDLEMTGTMVNKHGIHQISGYIVIDGEIKEKFNLHVRPNPQAQIDPAALEVAGVTEAQVKAYPPMEQVYAGFVDMLSKYADRYNKKDKFFLVGYNNASFDNQFLRAWFIQNGDKYFGSWFWANSIDVMVMATPYLAERRAEMENFKQGTVAKTLGIVVEDDKLHDALYDIEICKAIGACAIAAAWAANASPGSRGGITGFQAGAVMWEFIRHWNRTNNKTGMCLIDYDDMLYPQYENRFSKTITKDLMESLVKEAKKHIAEYESNPKSMVHPDVLAHWKKIAQGIPPFGYKVVDEKF